jgi:hypothetical protein
MTKMTIVADEQGQIIAAVMGHTLSSKHGDVEAQVSFHGRHKLHKVEVDDDVAKLTDAVTFNERLRKYVPRS